MKRISPVLLVFLNSSGLLIGLVLLSALPFLLSQARASANPVMPNRLETRISTCPAGDNPARQMGITRLLSLADELFKRDLIDSAFFHQDRAITRAIESKSPELIHSTVAQIQASPLWSANLQPNRLDRLQRLDKMGQAIALLDNPELRIRRNFTLSKAYQTLNANAKAIAIIDALMPDLNKLTAGDTTNLGLMMEFVEQYAQLKQMDKGRKIADRMAAAVRVAQKREPVSRHVLLTAVYPVVLRAYSLLGLTQPAETWFQELQRHTQESFADPDSVQVDLAIAYGNARPNPKSIQLFEEVIKRNAEADENKLIPLVMRYARSNQFRNTIRPTQLIKTPQVKFKARMELGYLATQNQDPNQAIQLGKLAAQHASESGSFSVGRDDVIIWLNQGKFYDRGTPEVMAVVEALELFVYDEVVTELMRGALRNNQPMVLDRALKWATQYQLPNATLEATRIHAYRNRVDAAIQTAFAHADPYSTAATLALYYHRSNQPKVAARIKQEVMGLLSRSTFGDPVRIAEIAVAVSAIEFSTGNPQAARNELDRALKQAKKALPTDRYRELTLNLLRQFLRYGHPELLGQLINAIPVSEHVKFLEEASAGLAVARENSFLLNDRVIGALLAQTSPSKEETRYLKVQFLLELLTLQTYSLQRSAAESTIQQLLTLAVKLPPPQRDSTISGIIPTIAQFNQPDRLRKAIALITDPTIRQEAQKFTPCF